jgi:hypothetical protein
VIFITHPSSSELLTLPFVFTRSWRCCIKKSTSFPITHLISQSFIHCLNNYSNFDIPPDCSCECSSENRTSCNEKTKAKRKTNNEKCRNREEIGSIKKWSSSSMARQFDTHTFSFQNSSNSMKIHRHKHWSTSMPFWEFPPRIRLSNVNSRQQSWARSSSACSAPTLVRWPDSCPRIWGFGSFSSFQIKTGSESQITFCLELAKKIPFGHKFVFSENRSVIESAVVEVSGLSVALQKQFSIHGSAWQFILSHNRIEVRIDAFGMRIWVKGESIWEVRNSNKVFGMGGMWSRRKIEPINFVHIRLWEAARRSRF